MPHQAHLAVLGPSKDLAGQSWPFELRLRLAKSLQRMQCPSVVMELVPELDGENAARKFKRILRDWRVRGFLVLWPNGCRLNGLDVELGWLLHELTQEHLSPEDVQLVTQVDHIGMSDDDAEGIWSMAEPGNRTRYYAALMDEGCTIRRYTSLADLQRNVRAAGLDHLQRHVLALNEPDFIGKAATQLRIHSGQSRP